MSTVHRLLDEAFAGQPSTPEVLDLKEEIRAGLVERAAELEAAGASADEAARRAVDELGDVAALVAEVAGTGRGTGDGGTGAGGTGDGRGGSPDAGARQPRGIDVAALAALHRVRPRPRFVVGAVVASILGAVALGALAALTVPGSPWASTTPGVPLVLAPVVALVGAWLVRESLLQETTTHHPLPARRATGWGGGSGLALLGAGVAASAWATTTPTGGTALVVAGAALAVAGVAWLSWLGATQTNRTKAWAREVGRASAGADRFSSDPRAAARFGVYTVAIWAAVAVAAVVVGVTAGWWWALLAPAAGFVAMMLTLARMLFGVEPPGGPDRSAPGARS